MKKEIEELKQAIEQLHTEVERLRWQVSMQHPHYVPYPVYPTFPMWNPQPFLGMYPGLGQPYGTITVSSTIDPTITNIAAIGGAS